jgi:voltage-gated potassium channel
MFEVKHMARKIIVLSLVAGYFFLWFGFGLIYKILANNTDGQAFSFNEDVRLQAIAKEAYSQLEGNVNLHTLNQLIGGPDSQRFAQVFIHHGDDSQTVYGLKPIGGHWAMFYSELLARKGITHYTIKALPPAVYPLDPEVSQITYLSYANPEAFLPMPKSSPYLLELFSGPNIIPTNQDDFSKLKIVSRHNIWLIHPPFFYDIYEEYIMAYNIGLLPESLQNSMVFLDDFPNRLTAIIEGRRSYPLLDFLYFSAVTITTLGFGDIVPNNTTVRVLVMFEAFLGLLIVGGLVSLLFNRGTTAASQIANE